jgi:hypothetical protein
LNNVIHLGHDATIASVEGEPADQLSYYTGRVPLARVVGGPGQERKMQLSFTCKVCNTRNTKYISHLVNLFLILDRLCTLKYFRRH